MQETNTADCSAPPSSQPRKQAPLDSGRDARGRGALGLFPLSDSCPSARLPARRPALRPLPFWSPLPAPRHLHSPSPDPAATREKDDPGEKGFMKSTVPRGREGSRARGALRGTFCTEQSAEQRGGRGRAPREAGRERRGRQSSGRPDPGGSRGVWPWHHPQREQQTRTREQTRGAPGASVSTPWLPSGRGLGCSPGTRIPKTPQRRRASPCEGQAPGHLWHCCPPAGRPPGQDQCCTWDKGLNWGPEHQEA